MFKTGLVPIRYFLFWALLPRGLAPSILICNLFHRGLAPSILICNMFPRGLAPSPRRVQGNPLQGEIPYTGKSLIQGNPLYKEILYKSCA